MLVDLHYVECLYYLMSHYEGLMFLDVLWQTGGSSNFIKDIPETSKGTCQFNFQIPPYSRTRDKMNYLYQ
jgi:hypothetical protein